MLIIIIILIEIELKLVGKKKCVEKKSLETEQSMFQYL